MKKTLVLKQGSEPYLVHYGVKGMKWGVRRYQNKDGTRTNLGNYLRRSKAYRPDVRLAKMRLDGARAFLLDAKYFDKNTSKEKIEKLEKDLKKAEEEYLNDGRVTDHYKNCLRDIERSSGDKLVRLYKSRSLKLFDEYDNLVDPIVKEYVKYADPDGSMWAFTEIVKRRHEEWPDNEFLEAMNYILTY